MTTIKQTPSRIAFKSDTSENWAKAKNFIPIKGEPIYYSDLNKIKIGDGQTKVNDLPFSTSMGSIDGINSTSTVELAMDSYAFDTKMQAVCDAINENGNIIMSHQLHLVTNAGQEECGITPQSPDLTRTPWRLDEPNSGSYSCYHTANLKLFDKIQIKIDTQDTLDLDSFTLYLDTVDGFTNVSRLQLWGFNSSNPASFYFRELPATAYSIDNALGQIIINSTAELAAYLPSADEVFLKVQWNTTEADNSYSEMSNNEGQSYKESVSLYGIVKGTSPLIYWNPETERLTAAPIEAIAEKVALQGGTRSQALSRNAFTYGYGNISGGKGFRILGLSKNGTTCVIKLDTSLGYSDEIKVGDEYSVRLSSASYKKGKVKSVDTTTHDSKHFISVTVDNFVSSLKIDAGEYNSPELGYCKNNEKIDEYKDDKAPSLENYFMIVGKPEVGNIDVGFNAFISGEGNIATDRDAVSFGRENQSIGQYSFTEGRQNIAAYAAHAEGRLNNALGEISHAEGYKTNVSGNYAHVEGASTVVTGAAAHAEGHKSQANGWYSHAEGNNTAANGTYSHAEGTETIAEGEGAHAEGAKTHATGANSHAEGELTEANGFASHAEGYTVQANGDRSHAEGDYEPLASNKEIKYNGISYIMNGAYGAYSHREGRNTRTKGPGSHAEGDGSFAVGSVSHAEGGNTIAEGYCSHSEGQGTAAIGTAAHAEGQETLAKGIGGAHAEGSKTKALGESSHAEGRETLANASFSHAEGCLTQALGLRSHAEGDKSAASFSKTLTGNGATVYGNATGHFSHREGRDTESYGQGSHAEGKQTTAYGENSHAEGYNTEAIGASSHAEGSGTIALGKASHASGVGTKATANYQTVIGKYNVEDPKALFIVGSGSGDATNKRANAFTAGNDGTDDYITVGEEKLTEGDLSKVKNTYTKEEVQGLVNSAGLKRKIVSELPPLETADENTIYMISINHNAPFEYLGTGGIGDNGYENYSSEDYIYCFYPKANKKYLIDFGMNSTTGDIYINNGTLYQKLEEYEAITWRPGDYDPDTGIVTQPIYAHIFNSPVSEDENLTCLISVHISSINSITSIESGDTYKEYMLIGGELKQIGDTSVDLTNYATKDELGDIEAALDAILAIQKELLPALTITFTIDDIEYTAIEGMTWQEWVDSEYNIDGWQAFNGIELNLRIVAYPNQEIVHPIDMIVANTAYHTK